jgi:hypothetical protein
VADAKRKIPEEGGAKSQASETVGWQANLETTESAVDRLQTVEISLLALGLLDGPNRTVNYYKWKVVHLRGVFRRQSPKEMTTFKRLSPQDHAELARIDSELTVVEEGTVETQRELLLTSSLSLHNCNRSLGIISGCALHLSNEAARISRVIESSQHGESHTPTEKQEEPARVAMDRRSNYEKLLTFVTASLKIQEQAIQNVRYQQNGTFE